MSRGQGRKRGADDYAVDFTGGDGLHGRSPEGAANLMSEANTSSSAPAGPLGEISQAPPALEVFLDRHQMKLVVLAVLLALFAIGYVIYEGIETSRQESAGAKLVKAEDISELQEVANNNQGTAAAESAKILLAEKQWEDGQQDDAIQTLESFVAEDAAHPARPSALASLASKLLSQGKGEEAEEILNEITSDPNAAYIAPYAWIMLGDIEAAKGDKEAAAAAYDTVEREFFDSPFSQQALQRKLLLKAAPPVEVEAKISVPDVNLTGDEGDAATEGGQTDDLLKAIQGDAGLPDANPLLPDQADPE